MNLKSILSPGLMAAMWIVASTVVQLGAQAVRAEDGPKFSRDVLPILSKHCFACHGPDASKREAELRLDVEEEAKRAREGSASIVPGDLAKSKAVDRIVSKDPDYMMPPPDFDRPLTAEQVETLKKWIAAGAPWGKHWSFEPLPTPQAAAALKIDDPQQIDHFVDASLKRAGLERSPKASAHTRLRRVWLDLVGLPPTPEQADAFAADDSPENYVRAVDELLAMPQFGEHWARVWLDLARYADTKGYEKDLGRSIWPYRDWVIKALNDDMPLDRFTEKQLAGDLLPEPTQDDLIATAFHRNTMSNDEGGTDDEEFRITAVKDRVDTTMQVWMGLTMGCAKCHSHKYDPITMEDYYRFYAVFNQTEDADRPNDAPTLTVLTEDRKSDREKLEEVREAAESALANAEQQSLSASDAASSWIFPKVTQSCADGGAKLELGPDGSLTATGPHPDRDVYQIELDVPAGRYAAVRIEAIPTRLPGARGVNAKRGVGRSAKDRNFVLSELNAFKLVEGQAPPAIAFGEAKSDFAQEGWPVAAAVDGKTETGWAVSPQADQRHAAVFAFAETLDVQQPTTLRFTMSQQYGGGLTMLKFRISFTAKSIDESELFSEAPAVAEARKQVQAAEEKLNAFDAATPAVPIMRELAGDKQRETRMHVRGNFLEPGDAVKPALLTAFHAQREGMPANRLGAARWLTDIDNPLTARVFANRVWARLFGIGIVETEEDFGALGSAPSDPELLDWLAVNYRDQGWSLKKLLRTIVLSETYQQSSRTSPTTKEKDPRNVLVGRGSRYRLPAEVVRDQALKVSGLLSMKQFGPPVMPPQPSGLWRSTYNGQKWIDAENEDRRRRSLYTYWKRTTPYPSLTTFDAGSREVCQIRRISTNTPLQALVTLNDPVFLEAAGGLARKMSMSPGTSIEHLQFGMRSVLVRPVSAAEVEPLEALRVAALADFAKRPEEAIAFCKSGRLEIREGESAVELAAWMTVSNAMLNLDEFLTRN
ncbi:MAG: PSD1 and planctomycete cytochrome C domain-containing protein [Pirellulales bacterium]